jgi:hypothetical protein
VYAEDYGDIGGGEVVNQQALLTMLFFGKT